VFCVLVKRMCQTFQRHVEGTVPGNHARSRADQGLRDLTHLGLRALSHIGWLIQLPDLGLGNLVVGGRNEWSSHVSIGSVVPNVLVSKFVVQDV